MTVEVKCDRKSCGKVISKDVVQKEGFYSAIILYNEEGEGESYDLCKECRNGIKRQIEGGNKQ